MLEKIGQWFNNYNTEITWFLIGLLVNNALIHVSMGQYKTAVLDLIIAGTNFYFWKTRNAS